MANRTLITGLVVAFAATGIAAPAWADRRFDSCSADGDTMNMSITYDTTSTQHIWDQFDADLVGNSNPNNNYRMSVWQNPDDRTWRHESADTWGGNEHYKKEVVVGDPPVHVRTQRSPTELVYMAVTFDQIGEDPSCTVKLTF